MNCHKSFRISRQYRNIDYAGIRRKICRTWAYIMFSLAAYPECSLEYFLDYFGIILGPQTSKISTEGLILHRNTILRVVDLLKTCAFNQIKIHLKTFAHEEN